MKIVSKSSFDWVTLFFITISCVTLALHRPLNDPNGTIEKTIYGVDVFTTFVFTVECLMKIVTFGLISNGRQSYLRDRWNMIDFVIVLLSIASLSPVSN